MHARQRALQRLGVLVELDRDCAGWFVAPPIGRLRAVDRLEVAPQVAGHSQARLVRELRVDPPARLVLRARLTRRSMLKLGYGVLCVTVDGSRSNS